MGIEINKGGKDVLANLADASAATADHLEVIATVLGCVLYQLRQSSPTFSAELRDRIEHALGATQGAKGSQLAGQFVALLAPDAPPPSRPKLRIVK